MSVTCNFVIFKNLYNLVKIIKWLLFTSYLHVKFVSITYEYNKIADFSKNIKILKTDIVYIT